MYYVLILHLLNSGDVNKALLWPFIGYTCYTDLMLVFVCQVGHRQGDFNNMDMGSMETEHANMDSDDLVPSLQVKNIWIVKRLSTFGRLQKFNIVKQKLPKWWNGKNKLEKHLRSCYDQFVQ